MFRPLPDNSGKYLEGVKTFVPKERLELSRPHGHRLLRPGCLPFHHLGITISHFKSAICHLLFCTPHRIRTDTCTGFKSDASTNWATGAYIKQKTRTFYGSGLYFIWSYLLHHEINPNFAQPEPAVLIHNVLFTTIVRFKFVIFRFIVLIISYILKSLSLFILILYKYKIKF